MKELIKIEEAVISNEKVNAVSARELHKVLGSKRKFSDWVKYKLNSTNFREGIDYITLSQTCDIANGASRTVETQYLTLDAAKHIAMLESTDIGHQVRDYFIAYEKKWNQKGRLFIHDLLKSLNIFATMDEEKIPSEPLSHKSFRYIYRNTKTDKPFEKWAKDYELSPITMPNSRVTMVDWILT